MKIKGLIFLEAMMSWKTLTDVVSKTSTIKTNKRRKEEADIMLTKPDEFHHQAWFSQKPRKSLLNCFARIIRLGCIQFVLKLGN